MKANQPTLLDDCKQTAKEEKVWQEYTNEIEKIGIELKCGV